MGKHFFSIRRHSSFLFSHQKESEPRETFRVSTRKTRKDSSFGTSDGREDFFLVFPLPYPCSRHIHPARQRPSPDILHQWTRQNTLVPFSLKIRALSKSHGSIIQKNEIFLLPLHAMRVPLIGKGLPLRTKYAR